MELPYGWWLSVKETFCGKCKKMTPCAQYQGHFICNICDSLTGFWMPIPLNNPYVNPHNAKDIEGPKAWSKDGTALVPVKFTLFEKDK